MVRHPGEHFIDVEGIAIASVLSFRAAGIYGTKFDAPETDRFSGDHDAPLIQEIFNIAVTEIESVVEPDSVGYDVGRKSVAFIGIHEPILPISDG